MWNIYYRRYRTNAVSGIPLTPPRRGEFLSSVPARAAEGRLSRSITGNGRSTTALLSPIVMVRCGRAVREKGNVIVGVRTH